MGCIQVFFSLLFLAPDPALLSYSVVDDSAVFRVDGELILVTPREPGEPLVESISTERIVISVNSEMGRRQLIYDLRDARLPALPTRILTSVPEERPDAGRN